MSTLELLVAIAGLLLVAWLIVARALALRRRPRIAITAVWTATDPDEGGTMSTFQLLEMERGARKRIRITGLDRRRNSVPLEQEVLTSSNPALLTVEADPENADAFIVTALGAGEGTLELDSDARPGDGVVAFHDSRPFKIHLPDAVQAKWNEEDLPDVELPPEEPAVGDTGAGAGGEQTGGEQ